MSKTFEQPESNDEEMTVTLDLEDGSSVECAIVTILTVNNQDYIVTLKTRTIPMKNRCLIISMMITNTKRLPMHSMSFWTPRSLMKSRSSNSSAYCRSAIPAELLAL